MRSKAGGRTRSERKIATVVCSESTSREAIRAMIIRSRVLVQFEYAEGVR